jgi:hypothetical protein
MGESRRAWRTPLVSVASAVFPESRKIGDITSQASLLAGSDIVSSLPLQVSLFFNVWYSPFWLVTSLYMFGFKATIYLVIYLFWQLATEHGPLYSLAHRSDVAKLTVDMSICHLLSSSKIHNCNAVKFVSELRIVL